MGVSARETNAEMSKNDGQEGEDVDAEPGKIHYKK